MPRPMVFEFPFNERVRTLMRLENAYLKLRELCEIDNIHSAHCAMLALFELYEVASKAELKNDLLQELERQRQALESYKGQDGVDDETLNGLLSDTQQCYQQLQQWQGKPGQHIRQNDWLTAIHSRVPVLMGLCVFDNPSYHHWLQRPHVRRHNDIMQWLAPFMVIVNSVELILQLLRNSQPVLDYSTNAQGTINIEARDRNYQLIRIWLPEGAELIPEFSNNRHSCWVQFSQVSTEARSPRLEQATAFKAALCCL